ncbi:MAG: hypothetical protein RLZZ505_202 [Verrucomicrobiota bacterium]|jgi:hypothetical protein
MGRRGGLGDRPLFSKHGVQDFENPFVFAGVPMEVRTQAASSSHVPRQNASLLTDKG